MPNAALAALTATTGNKTDCWNTPKEIVDKVVEYFCGPVELDPCSNSSTNPNIPCLRCFTEEDDGLSFQWNTNSVFTNHPIAIARLGYLMHVECLMKAMSTNLLCLSN